MAAFLSLLPVFDWVLWISVKVSVLILFLLLVRFLCGHKLPATAGYLLWAVVIVGLLLPWTPSSSLSLYNLARPYTQNLTTGSTGPVLDPNLQANSGSASVPPATNATTAGNLYPAAGTGNFNSAGEGQPGSDLILGSMPLTPLAHEGLFLIWLLGIAVFLIFTAVVNKKFSRTVQGHTFHHWYILAGLADVIKRLHLTRDIPLVFTPVVATPSLYGLFNPRILMPAAMSEGLTQEQLKFILVHELLHYKRRDIAVNWLMQGLLILHWFNPVLWYAFRKLREDQEQACDAMTVHYFGPDQANGYAGTLIKLLESYARPQRLANLTGLCESGSFMKRRLLNIKKLPPGSFALTSFIFGIVIFVAVITLADPDTVSGAGNGKLPLSAGTAASETAAGTGNDNLPLPTSATPITENQMREIPFPYTDKFANGLEQWVVERDSSGRPALKILFNGREKAVFPLNATGVNPAKGKITLDGKDYAVVSITLNNDQTSGRVTLVSLAVLPTTVQAVSISDETPAGAFWRPQSQDAVLAQVSAWLKTAIPYTAAIPSSAAVDQFVHHNIGPAALHLTGADNLQTLIYPAWYVQANGQGIEAGTISNYLHYQQDVVILIEARTNHIAYFTSAPLYRWLKNGEWKAQFNPDPALSPLYPTNAAGLTYGPIAGAAIQGNPQPDLVAASGADGRSGYVKSEDLIGPQPKTPAEAAQMQKEGLFKNRKIPLYAADGQTVVGTFP